MAQNLHSQVVLWLKVVLPLAALALLSTLFLFARDSSTAPPIPLADLNQMASEQMLNAPRFSGLADDGTVLTLSAAAARPGADRTFTIRAPMLQLRSVDGTSLVVQAGEGVINTATSTADLTGLARLETSSGYVMETTGLTADLTTGKVISHGALEVKSPFGSLDAGAVSFTASSDGVAQRMDFTQGVKLVYMP